MKKLFTSAILCVALSMLVLIIDKYSNFDIAFQNLFYNSNTQQWLITDSMHDSYLKYFFYSGYKSLVIVATVALSIATALSFLWRNSIFTKLAKVRIRYIIVIASIAFAPLTISTLKSVTNVFCPYELSMYNGKEDYIPILSRYAAETKPVRRGRGFPAGHSTSGFAFMSLYFISRDKRKKQLGLMYGIIAGWVTGGYQILRGRHFLSHTIVSMLLCWGIICIVVLVSLYIRNRRYSHR